MLSLRQSFKCAVDSSLAERIINNFIISQERGRREPLNKIYFAIANTLHEQSISSSLALAVPQYGLVKKTTFARSSACG